MAYIRCSEQVHRAVKREAADTGLSMQELAARAWGAYERERSIVPTLEGENFTTKKQSETGEITYSGERLQTLASEIGERAAAILQIAKKVRGPEIVENTGIPEQDIYEQDVQIAADTAKLSDVITSIEEQSGTAQQDRERAYPKVSRG